MAVSKMTVHTIGFWPLFQCNSNPPVTYSSFYFRFFLMMDISVLLYFHHVCVYCVWLSWECWLDGLIFELWDWDDCECGRIRKKKALFGGGIKQNKERRETNFLKFSQVQSIYLPFTVKIVTQEKNVSHSHNFKKITFVIPPILNTLLTAFKNTHNFSTQLQISQPLH